MAIYTVARAAAGKRKAPRPIPSASFFVRDDGFAFWAFLLTPAVDAAAPAVGWCSSAMCCSRWRCWSRSGLIGMSATVMATVTVLLSLLVRLRGGHLAAFHAWRARRWTNIGTAVGDDAEIGGTEVFRRPGWTRLGSTNTPHASPASADRHASSRRPTGVPPRSSACFRKPGASAVTVAIVDYGSGQSAFGGQGIRARAAREEGLAQPIVVTSDPEGRASAPDRVVLPGVGAFADCRHGLDGRQRHGGGARRKRAQTRAAVPRHLASACS